MTAESPFDKRLWLAFSVFPFTNPEKVPLAASQSRPTSDRTKRPSPWLSLFAFSTTAP